MNIFLKGGFFLIRKINNKSFIKKDSFESTKDLTFENRKFSIDKIKLFWAKLKETQNKHLPFKHLFERIQEKKSQISCMSKEKAFFSNTVSNNIPNFVFAFLNLYLISEENFILFKN